MTSLAVRAGTVTWAAYGLYIECVHSLCWENGYGTLSLFENMSVATGGASS